ncbi:MULTISPECIES: YodD family peroxide/acid resistance protein [Atlantibacter]|uniref:YodD family peroxide/acid resistance protein n=1 Tax=Atlantibacter hermannii NBRC 105704 TaxID=1115512 RepID=H5V0W2_ATLHE|nr:MULTISPECIES: YodD family peroxide/acid resistance protein [Atlantibacter]MCQ4968300.1 YodD family peroxide/acid resistance protein [Enterobacteriaceae bacterium DFI.7.85]HAI51350.1 DUF2525 domain-containing protein [Enterobacteriaceae bacterium]KIU35174.1 hypothetical protein SR38_04660 [Atlantibacter hermannii]MBW9432265.1 YodD family peroxide/acid resistance protein [Atlantibacter hermannii]MDQ7883648.1 YodD family peroxide/acid resistance protein [Atlantibacter hermannii]
MKTSKGFSENAPQEMDIDVEALLAAINEISESEVRPVEDEPHRVSVNGHDYHTYSELAEAFELDIRDFSVNEINR